MYLQGAGTMNFSGTGEKVTGDLVIGERTTLAVSGAGDHISDSGVVAIETNAQWSFTIGTGSETIKGLQGSGTMLVANGVAADKILVVDTDGPTNGPASDYTFSGTIGSGASGSGGNARLEKAGAGTWTLSGNNTYTMNTRISGGTLLVNGTHTNATAGRGYVVTNSGTLGGTGFISLSNGNIRVEAGGKLSPGSSPGKLSMALGTGQLNISNSVAAAGASNLIFELGAVGASDQIVLVTGFLDIGGGLLEFNDFVFSTNSGFVGGTYTLFDTANDIIGSLGAVTNGFIAGFESYLWFGDTGNDLLLTVIPEPGAVGLMLMGLAAMAAFRKRRPAA